MLPFLAKDPELAAALVTFTVTSVNCVKEVMRWRKRAVVVKTLHVHIHVFGESHIIRTLSTTDSES